MTCMNTYFGFEKLDAYQIAKEALVMVLDEKRRWKGLPGELAGQLERAMVSVTLNIAEGAGRASPADQKRHYTIARGSANEAAAALSIIAVYREIDAAACDSIRARLGRVVQMLNRLIG